MKADVHGLRMPDYVRSQAKTGDHVRLTWSNTDGRSTPHWFINGREVKSADDEPRPWVVIAGIAIIVLLLWLALN